MRWRSKPFHRWECVSQRFVVPLNFLQKIMNHEISSSEAPEKQGTHNPWRNQVMYRRCVSNRLAYPQNKGCLKRKSRGNQSRKPRGPMWNPQPKIIQTGGRGYSWGNRTRMTGTHFSPNSESHAGGQTYSLNLFHKRRLRRWQVLQPSIISHFMRSDDKCYVHAMAVAGCASISAALFPALHLYILINTPVLTRSIFLKCT